MTCLSSSNGAHFWSISTPLPFHELVEGFGNMQEVLDEMSVEIDKPYKGLDLSHILWG